MIFQIVKSSTDSSQLGPLAAKLAHQFSNLAGDTRGAVASTSNLEVSIYFMWNTEGLLIHFLIIFENEMYKQG